jgi:hypothetical protein
MTPHYLEDLSVGQKFRHGLPERPKRIDGAYQSGPCRVWIKVRNPTSIAVQRERSEKWSR